MPTVFEVFGLRFFFYSDEHLPIHIHVQNGDGRARIILEPDVALDYNEGLKAQDLKKALKMVEIFKHEIINKWNEHFDE